MAAIEKEIVRPFFSKRFPIFGTYAMLILCMVCFLLPFAGRGARLAISSMQNNVADWLPNEYEETEDLATFRQHFVGDQFAVVSGDWCRQGNNTFVNFVRKLREESLEYEADLKAAGREEELRAHRKGDELGLLYTGDYHESWGEARERWLLGRKGQWYYINREGDLFRWDGQNNIFEGLQRYLERQVSGRNKAIGTYIDRFGELPDDVNGIENEFYADPLKLCARPFKSISTGPDVFEKMAGENGTRRIGPFDDADASSFETKIKTHQLLTGSMFGPTPEPTFSWTFESLLHHVDVQRQLQLKSNPLYRERFRKFVEFELQSRFAGSFDKLRDADPETKLELWYRLWDAIELEAPSRQTCIILTLNEPVLGQLDRVVGRPILGKPRGRILELATGSCGISAENLHIGGPPADNVAIDEEGTTTLLRLVNLSALIGIGLSYACFRSIRLTFMLFFVGGVAAISSLAFVWFGGSTLDAILMSMPSLVYVLGISGAVHYVNYYREACEESGPATAAEVAFQHGWFPCSLAAFTTALGLISLYTSGLIPIQKFGLYSAIATIATVALTFTFLPAAITIWPPGFRRRQSDEPEKPSWLTNFVTETWVKIGEWVIRHNIAVVVTSLILVGFFGYGIFNVRTSVHLLKLFDSDAKIINDYGWLEENLGKLVPMELVVCIDKDSQQEPVLEQAIALREANSSESSDLEQGESAPPPVQFDRLEYDLKYSMLERMELSRRVRTNVERFFGPTGLDTVGPGMSTDVFAPIELIGSQIDPGKSVLAKFSPRALFDEQLAEKRADMIEEDYLAVVGDANGKPDKALAGSVDPDLAGREMWRISLRLAALNDVDYGDFVMSLKAVVEPIMKAYEFRTEILKSLQEQLGEESLFRGQVLVLARNPDRMKQKDAAAIAAASNVMEMVDQTFIFSNTLRDLLENRGFSNKYQKDPKPPYAEKRFQWVDPTVVDAKQVTPEKFAKLVSQHDCVVLVEDHPIFDEQLIREHAKAFIDCRDHGFAIDPKTNTPVGGKLTAMQRIKRDGDLDIGTIYTGIIPIVYKAQNQLLKSLGESIVLAFVMIAFVMMILLRNWRGPVRPGNLVNMPGGLISMWPNIFPIVIIFGAMGHLNIAVDIGSMMTASVAMGVAVDDTIHYLTWYRKSLQSGLSRLDSIRMAYRRVATAMTQTTLIGGLGLSAFALSTFTPTQKFGVLMLLLLTAALIGDLIILPAILASPLGRFFGKPREQLDQPQDSTDSLDLPIIHEFEPSEAESGVANAEIDDDFPDIHPDSLRHRNRWGSE